MSDKMIIKIKANNKTSPFLNKYEKPMLLADIVSILKQSDLSINTDFYKLAEDLLNQIDNYSIIRETPTYHEILNIKDVKFLENV